MKLYWVSTIIQDKGDNKPWLCASSESELSLEDAMNTITKARTNYTVLSAWIDTFDENNKKDCPLALYQNNLLMHHISNSIRCRNIFR